jgi:hypothetical protein
VATTVTAATPVTTVTSTVTTTVTPTACNPFKLQVVAPGTPDDGFYVTATVVGNGIGPGGYWVEFTNDKNGAPFFAVNSTGTALLPPFVANNGDPLYLAVFDKYLVVAAGADFDRLTCSVNAATSILSCVDAVNSATHFAIAHLYADQLAIETSVTQPDYPISLKLVCS